MIDRDTPLSSKLLSSNAVSKKRTFEKIFRYANYFKFMNRDVGD